MDKDSASLAGSILKLMPSFASDMTKQQFFTTQGHIEGIKDQQYPLKDLPAFQLCFKEISSWIESQTKQPSKQCIIARDIAITTSQRIVSPLRASIAKQDLRNIDTLVIQRQPSPFQVGSHILQIFIKTAKIRKGRVNAVLAALTLSALECPLDKLHHIRISNTSSRYEHFSNLEQQLVPNSPHLTILNALPSNAGSSSNHNIQVHSYQSCMNDLNSGLHYSQVSSLRDSLKKELVKAFQVLFSQLCDNQAIVACIKEPTEQRRQKVSECDMNQAIVKVVELICNGMVQDVQNHQQSGLKGIDRLSQAQLNQVKSEVMFDCHVALSELLSSHNRENCDKVIIHQHPLSVMLPHISKELHRGLQMLDCFVYHSTYLLPLIQSLMFFLNVVSAPHSQRRGFFSNVGAMYSYGESGSGKSFVIDALSKGVKAYQLQQGAYQNPEIVNSAFVTADDTQFMELSLLLKENSQMQVKNMIDYNMSSKFQVKFKPDVLCTKFEPILISSNKDFIASSVKNKQKNDYQKSNAQSYFRRLYLIGWVERFDKNHQYMLVPQTEHNLAITYCQCMGSLADSQDGHLAMRLAFIGVLLNRKQSTLPTIDLEKAGLSQASQLHIKQLYQQTIWSTFIETRFEALADLCLRLQQEYTEGLQFDCFQQQQNQKFQGCENQQQFFDSVIGKYIRELDQLRLDFMRMVCQEGDLEEFEMTQLTVPAFCDSQLARYQCFLLNKRLYSLANLENTWEIDEDKFADIEDEGDSFMKEQVFV